MTERELLAAVANGNQDALQVLYERYYPRLCRFLLRLTEDDGVIGEVINDTFLVIWQKASQFRGESSPSTWFIGIAYRKALKTLERQRTHETLDVAAHVAADPPPNAELNEAIAALPAKQRAVLVLTYEFGYSYREIGEIVDCPENTVKTRMYHARKALKALLETDR